MPRLTLRTTVVLVSLLFSVCFTLQLLGRSSSPRAAMRATQSPLVERPGAAPKLTLVAAQRVPSLQDPRKPKPKPKPKPKRRKVVAAPTPAPVEIVPTATATPTPTPTATAAPAPRYIPPARTPAPTPKASPAPSGNFDTSGAE